ncbi:MAG: hypothetical protein J6J66_07495 [Clostridia bacterium]|nr:hypothetical protein [Clostridia bacterium]
MEENRKVFNLNTLSNTQKEKVEAHCNASTLYFSFSVLPGGGSPKFSFSVLPGYGSPRANKFRGKIVVLRPEGVLTYAERKKTAIENENPIRWKKTAGFQP